MVAQLSAGGAAVITGGASGLGLATARALAARGARIALIDVDEEAVHAAAGSLGGEAIGIAADIRDPADVAAAIDRIVERFGAIDVLMAGAGIVGWGPAGDRPKQMGSARSRPMCLGPGVRFTRRCRTWCARRGIC
ncbi:MAG: SDR family NAD(P)-dependent oxidoreductase [Solirubrobacteraceae bacterium]